MYVCRFSRVRLFAASWTAARQAPLSMEFFRREYWSGLPFLSPGSLPNPGIEPVALASPILASEFFTTAASWEAQLTNFFAYLYKDTHIHLHSVLSAED